MYESGWTGNLTKPYQKAATHYKSYLVEEWKQLKIMQVKIIKDDLYLLNRIKLLKFGGFFVSYIENFRFVYKCLLQEKRL